MLNILIAGIGGQGVVVAGKVIMMAFLKKGFQVKRSEIHGMAQRGGSVTVHVRIGKTVLSPTISEKEAHFVLALDEKEGKHIRHMLTDDGCYLELSPDEKKSLFHSQCKNVALLAKFFYFLGSISNPIPNEEDSQLGKKLSRVGTNMAKKSHPKSVLTHYHLKYSDAVNTIKEVFPEKSHSINLSVFEYFYKESQLR